MTRRGCHELGPGGPQLTKGGLRCPHHGAPHLSVWLPAGLGAQEALIESDPQRYFRPPYVGSSGWVGVVLDTRPDWGVVAWLVEQAYRLVAHPRLVAQLPPRAES